MSEPSSPSIKPLPDQYDKIALDGSRIRLLPETKGASMAHGTLDPGEVSRTGMHPMKDEIWYVVGGEATIWLKPVGSEGEEYPVTTDTSLTIPAFTYFQYRTEGAEPFRFIMCTVPPWKEGEAGQWVSVPNHWEPNCPPAN